MPSVLVRAARPPRWNASKMRSFSSSAMPMPVSRTLTCASSPARRAWTVTDPPSGVNFTALVSRFRITCLSLRSSAVRHAEARLDVAREARSRGWRRAREPSRRRARSGPPGTTGSRSISIWPASTFDRSRISLISSSRWRPESRMSRTYSSCRPLSSPNIRSSRTSEKPMTAFSGVRSSCDMLARNSDLCRLATSTSRVLCSSSWNTRALWIATTDWPARVSRRSTVSSGSAPGTVRRTTSEPKITSSRRSGSTTIERHPWARSASTCGSGGSASRSGAWRTSPAVAAPPMNVPCSPIRISRSAPTSSVLVPAQVRSTNSSASASNSNIEPPSAPESSAAHVTIVVRTWPRSRLELTVWLISPSAWSSSTSRACCALRCSSC